jgi:hypothetical protein
VTFRLLDALRLEHGPRWGDVATELQQVDARAVLDPRSAKPFHWWGRSRGYSKTLDLAAITLEILLTQAPPGSRSYAVAADRDQARLLLDSIEGFVRRVGRLAEVVEVQSSKVIVPKTGATLEAFPADEAGAWGLRPYFAVCDEIAQWATTRGPQRIWEAIVSAIPKTPGARLVVATTAGSPGHWSAKLRGRAIADPLWRVSEVHGPPPWMPTELIEGQRRLLPESSFQRLFENLWVTGDEDLVSPEDLAAAAVLDGPLDPVAGTRYVIGLDVGLRRDRTVAAVAHMEGGVVFLDRMAVWQGSRLRPVKLDEVEAWLADAARRYPGRVVVDPWQAAQLVERLRRRGVNIAEYVFSAQSVSRLANTLYVLLRNRAIRLPADDEELLDELRNVRLRETSPGVFRIDHDAGRHDDRAISLALAAHRLVERGERRSARLFVPRGRIPGFDRGDPLAGISVATGIPIFDGHAEAAGYGIHLTGGRR